MPHSSGLADVGFSDRWQALFAEHVARGLLPGRVVRADRGSDLVVTEGGVVRAGPAPHLLKSLAAPSDMPAVGDWVALSAPADASAPVIEAVLPRASAIVRGDPGKSTDVQVLAANVDVVFVVHPIAEAPNLRRIERELSLAWGSGAKPVVVLTKADLSEDAEAARQAVEAIAFGVDVFAVDALAGEGIEPLAGALGQHGTAVLIGPSGAGKSTLVNALLGEQRQATGEVRASDGRGRHTTVTRELITLPAGGVLIDTPGLRSLALTGSDDGIAAAFPDIEELAAACRFRDCTHSDEPGCAVLAAVEAGTLPRERLDSFHKLLRESEVAAARTDARQRAEEQRKAKSLGKAIKEYNQRFRDR